ncbi:MAG: ABC transporter permease, partial [Alphaproteobacteria bacterium]|nr:ABC transporter permease [Alphaproteobacteria bacterium]
MLLTRFERLFVRRYLLPGRGEAFIAIVAGFSLFAVTIGVAALIVIMSVMNGFRAELFDRFVGLNGHAVIQGYDGRLDGWQAIVQEARATPGVTSATPLIEQPLMASNGGRVEGILLRGMDVADIRANRELNNKNLHGALDELTPGSGNVAIGDELANELGASLGSTISIVNPAGESTPFGTVPKIISVHVSAIFRVGIYDFDKAYVIMPMRDAQNLLLLGDAVQMVKVNTVDPDRVGTILAPLQARIAGRAVISDWRSTNQALFKALAVDRVGMFIVVTLIIIVAMFNIISSLIMLVRAKMRDIAVLRTMGASRRSILRIFISIGMAVGTIGTLAGLVIGFILLSLRNPIINGIQRLTGQQLWDPSIRFLDDIPTRTDWSEVFMVVAMT